MTNTTHAEALTENMRANTLGAIDRAIADLGPDVEESLGIHTMTGAWVGYVISGPNMRLRLWVNDNVLHAQTETRPGVVLGPQVAITNPTEAVVLAVVATMLASVIA